MCTGVQNSKGTKRMYTVNFPVSLLVRGPTTMSDAKQVTTDTSGGFYTYIS